jgi:subtilisin family serine protease
MKKSELFLLLTAGCSFLFFSQASAQDYPDSRSAKVDVAAQEAAKDQLIVGFKSGISREQKNTIHGQVNAKVIKSFKIINAELVRLAEGTDLKTAIDKYKRKSGVAYAERNYIVGIGGRTPSAPGTPDDPRFEELWGLHNTGQTGGTADVDIDAPEAWDITTGSSSVIVAVIDTGIDYNHEDLAANMWVNTAERDGTPGVDDDGNGFTDDIYGYDFCNNDGDPFDDHSHGTHCAGTIGAVGDNGVGVVGVNHTVSLMALKFLSSYGSGYTSDAVECIEYAILMGADILSNSWGGAGYSQALKDAIEAFPGVVVCGAGNDWVNTDYYPHYPSSYDSTNIISVNTIDHLLNSFYNFGQFSVDIAAPGRSILSTTPGDSYGLKNGTSMSTPHVAGVAALIKAQYPSATTGEIIDYIFRGAELYSYRFITNRTSGVVNAFNSLNAPSWGAGSLQVTIEPSAAVSAGAQWRRAGTTTWRGSGETESDIPAGSHSIEFKNITDWQEPYVTGVTLDYGGTTSHTGTYYSLWSGPDAYGYSGSSSTGGFEDISLSGTAITFYNTDNYTVEIPLGFTFYINGQPFSDIFASTNGALLFWPSCCAYIEEVNLKLLAPIEYWHFVLPFWDDLDLWDDGFVVYQVKGEEPFKRFIIQWRAYHHLYPDYSPVEFQVKLYQSYNDIEFCYKDVYFGHADIDQGKSATIGMQNRGGLSGLQYSYNGNRLLSDGQKIRICLPPRYGDLKTVIYPAEAISAGAQWRRVGTTNWLNSGYTEHDLPYGPYEIEFKNITGWDKPENTTVALLTGYKLISATYTQTGSLQVETTPQAASDAGARWRRVGTSTWLESGYTETAVPVGSVTIEYKDLTGWNKPANETVDIAFHETTSTTGVYVQQTGSLNVTITPQQAIDLGAKWRRSGTTTWLESGHTESGIPVGSHTVEYRTVAGYNKPVNQEVTINYNETATATGNYSQFALSLAASNGLGMPGDTVPINITLSKGTGVRSFGFDVSFDPNYLEYQYPVTKGTLLPAGFTFDFSLIDNHIVRISGSSGDGEATLNEAFGTLASINFKIKEDVDEGTTVDIPLAEVTGDIRFCQATNGSVEVVLCVDNYDVNLDGYVTPGDALMTFQHYLGLIEITNPCSLLRADANNDGFITPGDALIIFRAYLGLD